MSIPYLASRIRLRCEADRFTAFNDAVRGTSPAVWRGTDLDVDIGAFYLNTPVDVADYASITVEVKDNSNRTGSALMSKTTTTLDAAMTAAGWTAGTEQHATVSFSAAETQLSLTGGSTANQKEFWMVVSALTLAGKKVTLGGGVFIIYEDGHDASFPAAPIVGANLVTGGPSYDGSGNYTLSGLTAAWVYNFVKGANDTGYTNGGGIITADGDFTTVGTSIVLKGTPSAVVTSVVREVFFLTQAEMQAMFIAGSLRWRGTWSSGTTYAAGDVVYYSGSAWRASRTNLAVTPVVGADWAYLALGGTNAVVFSTSTTSIAVGTGSKSFTTASALDVTVGAFLVIARTSAPATFMYGQVTAISGTSVTLSVSSIGGSGTHTDWSVSLSGARPKTPIGVALTGTRSDVVTGTAKETIRLPVAMQLESVMASLTVASGSGLVTVDINKNGVSILSTKLTIDALELTSLTAAAAAVISDTALAADDEITFDVDTAGTGAKGLKVWLVGRA